MKKILAVTALITAIALSGCTSQNNSEPIAAKPTTSASPKPKAVSTEPDGSRAHPYLAGTKALLAKGSVFTIGFQPSNLNASDAVMKENQFNKIIDGHSPVLAPVTVSISDGGGQDLSGGVDIWTNLTFEFVTAAGRSYGDSGSSNCGVYPSQMSDVGTLYVGATAEANVCAQVPSDQIAGGAWAVSNGKGEKLFFKTA